MLFPKWLIKKDFTVEKKVCQHEREFLASKLDNFWENNVTEENQREICKQATYLQMNYGTHTTHKPVMYSVYISYMYMCL